MRGALEGVRVVMERESSLKFTKYDCANLPEMKKIFGKDFKVKSNESGYRDISLREVEKRQTLSLK